MKKRGNILLISIVLIIGFSAFSYGGNFFYSIKTYVYKNEVSQINIETKMNSQINNIDVNFINKGSCEVFLRANVFVYVENNNEENVYKLLKNSSININYGDDKWQELWYQGDDDYIYYKKHLSMDEKTEIPLIKSIELNLSNEEKEFLRGKEIKVDIITEAVQKNNAAYKYEWDIDDETLEKYFKGENNIKENEFNNSEGIRVIVQ